MNPYVVPLAGVPWAAFLSSTYLVGELSAHIRVFDEIEIGVLTDAGLVQDLGRTGAEDFGGVLGLGAFADLRWGPWQGDLRVGWAPELGWQARGSSWSLYLALGRRLL